MRLSVDYENKKWYIKLKNEYNDRASYYFSVIHKIKTKQYHYIIHFLTQVAR